jgi:hypothetical protein
MPATQRRVIRAMCPMSCHPTLCGMLVEPQAIIATLLVEYGLRARERTEAGLGSFERLAVRHAFFHTDD